MLSNCVVIGTCVACWSFAGAPGAKGDGSIPFASKKLIADVGLRSAGSFFDDDAPSASCADSPCCCDSGEFELDIPDQRKADGSGTPAYAAISATFRSMPDDR